MNTAKDNSSGASITKNKRAFHDYDIEDRLEAGIALEGWEVKSLRAGRVQINDAHAIIKRGEIWLLGAVITPLATTSTHIHPESNRTRKLLLHKKELSQLIGKVERKGYTLVPLSLYWKKNKAKVELALAKGKKLHDKRASTKEKDWKREQARLLKYK